MQNQQNNASALQTKLNVFRAEIDKIDEEIINLLEERMDIISQVSVLKKQNNEKLFVRSSREADMIKNLLQKKSSKFPASTIVNIWRKIITAANMHEQDLKIALHNPRNISDYNFMVRDYYNDEVPLTSHDSVNAVVSDLEKGDVQIGIFALPQNDGEDLHENWWINLANNKQGIRIFAKIPFMEFEGDKKKHSRVQLVAAGIKEDERSEKDISLLCIELKPRISKLQLTSLFEVRGLQTKILKSAKLAGVEDVMFHLVEVEGFFEENSEKIIEISNSKLQPYIKILGHYAAPIKV